MYYYLNPLYLTYTVSFDWHLRLLVYLWRITFFFFCSLNSNALELNFYYQTDNHVNCHNMTDRVWGTIFYLIVMHNIWSELIYNEVWLQRLAGKRYKIQRQYVVIILTSRLHCTTSWINYSYISQLFILYYIYSILKIMILNIWYVCLSTNFFEKSVSPKSI